MSSSSSASSRAVTAGGVRRPARARARDRGRAAATRRSSSAMRSRTRFSSTSTCSRADSAAARPRRPWPRPRAGPAAPPRRAPAVAPLPLARGALRHLAYVRLEPALGFGDRARRVAPWPISASSASFLPDLAGEIAVARRLPRLLFQAVDLRVDLLQDILEPGEIVLRPFEPQLRLVAARMQAGDARRLLQNQPALPAAWRK